MKKQDNAGTDYNLLLPTKVFIQGGRTQLQSFDEQPTTSPINPPCPGIFTPGNMTFKTL